jgi:hypothetical protein
VARKQKLRVKCNGRPGKGGAIDGAKHYAEALEDGLKYGVKKLLVPKQGVLVHGKERDYHNIFIAGPYKVWQWPRNYLVWEAIFEINCKTLDIVHTCVAPPL